MKINSVEGNRQSLDGGAMFGNAPKTVWSKWLTSDSFNRVELACRAVLLDCGGTKVLFETGIGRFFEPKLADRYGVFESEHMLLKNLETLGLTDSDLDYVVLSHLHFDHAGGLLPAFGGAKIPERLLFPNAHFLVGGQAWQRARNPHPRDRASFIPGMTDLLEKSGRLILIGGDSCKELPAHLRERLSFFYSSGHTPGQMHSVLRGDRKNLIFCGDLVPGRAWVHLPITMGYDRFPEKVIEEKELAYQTYGDTSIFFYTHDAEVAGSEIHKSEGGRWEAQSAITKFADFGL